MVTPCSDFICEASLAAEEPKLVPPRPAPNLPPMYVEAVRGVRPGSDVKTPATRLCAAGADQLPRASLRDAAKCRHQHQSDRSVSMPEAQCQ